MSKQWCMGLLCCLLGLAGRAQVNLQTGSAQYSLPIFNYANQADGLTTAVSIAYSSGNGLKIDDRATNVGTGWTLNAGGFVERKTIGEPDDQYCSQPKPVGDDQLIIKRELSDWTVFEKYYPNGRLYSEFSVQELPKQMAILPRFSATETKDYKQTPRASTDREADIFTVNLDGRIVRFVIGRKSNGTGIDPALISCVDDSKLQFDVTTSSIAGCRTTISAFKITDESATEYVFDVLEFSYCTRQVKKAQYTTKTTFTHTPLTIYKTEKTDQKIVSRWYLSSKRNLLTGAMIRYSYNEMEIQSTVKASADLTVGADVTDAAHPKYSPSVDYSYLTAYTQAQRINNIVLPDGVVLYFDYDSDFYRGDVTGDHPLKAIRILKGSDIIKQYQLTYGFFYRKQVVNSSVPFNSWGVRALRLCLKSISTGEGMLPYKFEYNTGDDVAAESFHVPQLYCVSQDYWGYYNDNAVLKDEDPIDQSGEVHINDAFVQFLSQPTLYRNPKPLYASLGLLRKVILPEGGSLNYEYAQRTRSTGDYVGGVCVSKIKMISGEDQPDQVVEYKYVQENNTSSLWGYEDPLLTLGYHNTALKQNLSYQKAMSRLYSGNQDITSPYTVSFFAEQLIKMQVKSMMTNFIKSMSPQLANAISFVGLMYTISEFASVLGDDFSYFENRRYPFDFYAEQNPLPQFFTRVEVTDLLNGKVVYEFTKPQTNDYLVTTADYTFPFSEKQRLEDWRYGLTGKQTVYDHSGNKIEQSENTYTISSAVHNDPSFLSRKIAVNRYMSNNYASEADNNSWVTVNNLSYEDYGLRTGKAFATKATKRSYENNSEVMFSEISNTYDMAHNTLRKTETVNSKGEKVGQTFYYPYDYNTGLDAGLDVLKSRNVLLPVTTVSWVEKNGSKMVTGFSTSTYTILWNDNVKVQRTYTSRLTDPVAHTLPDAVDPSNLYNYPALNLVAGETTAYNVYGLPISKTDAHGRVAGFVYDNRNQLIGEATGASHTEIACTSFESTGIRDFDHSNPNGLDLGNDARLSLQLGQVKDDQAFTGEHAYHLGTSGSFTFNLNTQRASVFSFWASSAAFTVANAGSLRTSGPTINGWTYYEYNVPANAPAPVITGSGAGAFIDEVRLYPAGSRMSTTTYNAAGLASSQCDANNRVVYSEYDALWRPVKLRDAYRNVIKTYEYHYKGN